MNLPFNIVFASSVENFWYSWSCWSDQALPKTQCTQALGAFMIWPGKIITTRSLSATLWLCLWYSIGHSFLCSFLCFLGGVGLILPSSRIVMYSIYNKHIEYMASSQWIAHNKGEQFFFKLLICFFSLLASIKELKQGLANKEDRLRWSDNAGSSDTGTGGTWVLQF